MAEIPVKRESGGIPWWVWALLALLVLALLFWLFDSDDETETMAVDPVAPVAVAPLDPVAGNTSAMTAEGTANATGPITDIATFANTGDLTGLVGREVQLSNVRVQEVVGDRSFWVGPSADQRAFVVLNEVPTPGTPTEGRYDVTAGQTINVNGQVRNVTDPTFAANPIEGLPSGQQAVIHAQSLDIVERP